MRTQREWTLAQLSERTGLQISTLSRIENGKVSLSYDLLSRLSAAFDLDIGQLLSDDDHAAHAPSRARRSVTRTGEGIKVETPAYSYYFPASDLINKKLVPIFGEIRARSLEEFGNLLSHRGEEFVTVLEGAVELHTDEYAALRLEVGDSVYFDSSMGHAYIAAAPGVCRIVAVCSTPASELISTAQTSGRPSRVSRAASEEASVEQHTRKRRVRPPPRVTRARHK